MSSPSKSCDVDPLPIVLLQAFRDVLTRLIAGIINASLLFPDNFYCAHVNQVLKNTPLPKDDVNSYTPMSNLSII